MGHGRLGVRGHLAATEPAPCHNHCVEDLAAWTDVYRNWTFEDKSLGLPVFEVPGSRDGLAGWLYSAQDGFRTRVEALEDADLVELRPAHYGPHLPIYRLVSGIANRERSDWRNNHV
jgi:hypothetical protein